MNLGFFFAYESVKSLSCVRLFVTQWIIAHQAPLFMEFSGKNTGVGCPFLLQGVFLTQGSNRVSCIAGKFFTIWAILFMGSRIWTHWKYFLDTHLNYPGLISCFSPSWIPPQCLQLWEIQWLVTWWLVWQATVFVCTFIHLNLVGTIPGSVLGPGYMKIAAIIKQLTVQYKEVSQAPLWHKVRIFINCTS